MILAAEVAETTTAFLELGVGLVALGILAWLAGLVQMSPIPLYLLAGLLAGIGGPLGDHVSAEFVSLAAEIGVLLLLFTLGLDYTAQELTVSLARGAGGGLLDFVLNFGPGFVIGLLIGWSPVAAIVLGGATYSSSSGVISKLIGDLGRIGNRETPIVLTVLVFEDLVMAVYLPIVAVLLTGSSMLTAAGHVALALAVVFLILVGLQFWGAPLNRFLERHSEGAADEVVLLAVFGGVLFVGGLVEKVDVSAAVGAFLVGVAISGPVQQRAAGVIVSLRDLFAAIFFFVFAMGIDLAALPPVLPVAAVLAGVGVLTKIVTGWFVVKNAGIGVHGRWRAGTALVARGEFSIVIAGLGTAAGVEADLAPVAGAYVLILAVLGPLLTRRERAPVFLTPKVPA